MTVFSLHISATLHLTIFGIWSNNIQSVQYVICVMIVRGLWYIGLAIRYTIWIVAHLCTSRGTFLRINTVSPWRDCRASLTVLQLAVNHKPTAIWLVLRILAGNEHCNVCDGNMVSEYIFNFFMATYEWMHPKYVCRICNYLFCIHAKLYKHISPSYYKPDAQSLLEMFILDCFTVQYSRIPQPLGSLNSATIGHIAIILFAFYSEYC